MKRNLIALTGGIGSGKSTALSIIKDLGFPVFSCDEYTKKAYQNKKIQNKLKRAFGTADKDELKKTAFDGHYDKISKILTPYVFKITLKDAKKVKGKVFVEVPLLFENGYEKYFDNVLVIVRSKKLRIESVKTRSNLTEEEIEKRIKKQTDYDSKDLSGYTVIENNGTENDLKEKIEKNI